MDLNYHDCQDSFKVVSILDILPEVEIQLEVPKSIFSALAVGR